MRISLFYGASVEYKERFYMSVGVKILILVHTVTTPVPRDNQRDREQQTLLKSIRSHRE